MSVSIGIDVSELRMGWAIVSYDDQTPLALGVEDLRERDGGYAEDQVLRSMRRVSAEVEGLREEVYVVGIEDAYQGPSVKRSLMHASIVGMATMAARVVFGESVVYWPIPNGTWLNPLGITPASRKRDDVKAATMAWAVGVLQPSGTFFWEMPIEQDAADALGVATACALLTVEKAAA